MYLWCSVQLLLKSGADVNYGTANGWTPLHSANIPAFDIAGGENYYWPTIDLVPVCGLHLILPEVPIPDSSPTRMPFIAHPSVYQPA